MDLKHEEALVRVGERIANSLEELAKSLAPLKRAANLVPSRKQRVLEALYAAHSVNTGELPDIAFIEKKADELERHLNEVIRLGG